VQDGRSGNQNRESQQPRQERQPVPLFERRSEQGVGDPVHQRMHGSHLADQAAPGIDPPFPMPRRRKIGKLRGQVSASQTRTRGLARLARYPIRPWNGVPVSRLIRCAASTMAATMATKPTARHGTRQTLPGT